jgi:phage shock protein PspC (stress-responsive transcriptional regulator)
MNKTVTINISGIIFHIEEDAYDSLSKYLATIKGYFSNTDGGNEILVDIEARIAELLQEKINTSKQVILMMDVEYVKGVMGKPEDFGADNSHDDNKSETESAFREEKAKRRLFRDPEERLIGGVCSGLANYFNIDTVWVRLAMFLLIFFGGISLWVYVVLWIIIPLAKTTADRFAMRGESANVNNIIKSFKEEAEDVKARVNKYGREFRSGDYANSVRSNAGVVLNAFFNIVGRLIGLFIFLIGAVLLFAYLTSLFGISVANSNTDIAKWKSVIFESSSDYAMGVVAFIIVAGIPVFMMIYGGIKLLFRIRYSNRWLNMSLGILWTLGLILGFYITVSTVKQFNESSRLKESVELHGTGDTIIVKLNPYLNTLNSLNIDNKDDLEHYLSNNNSGYYFGEENRKLSVIGYPSITVSESTGDSVELIINRVAKGVSKREANENAKAINYTYHQNGNELVFDAIFSVNAGSKFRAQELDIKIALPKGKVIYFDKSTKYVLDDVENTTHTWDGDMINRRWKMTDKGLDCIDCENLFDDEDEELTRHHHLNDNEYKSKNITINDHGIKVNGKEAEIKIDKDGIRIKTPEKEYEIKDDHKDKD